MLNNDLFTGKLVRLSTAEPEEISKRVAGWHRDSEYGRLLGSHPVYPFSTKNTLGWMDKLGEFEMFLIRTLDDNRLIGDIGLDGHSYIHGDSYVGISIGDRADWSKGYGTDAMRIILRYAFQELDLHRVSLTVFEYNPRAVRSYEKAGFRVEGRTRQWLNRGGRRWDVIHMGILRSEWEEINHASSTASVS